MTAKVEPPANQPRRLTVSDLKYMLDKALADGLDPDALFSVDDGVVVSGVYSTTHGRWQSSGRPYFAAVTAIPKSRG